MKCFLFILSFFILVSASAQTDTAAQRKEIFIPLISLSKSQIQRLPVGNFMEMVNQAFPFVSGNPVVAEDYSFEVDGFITINPNAINISQIEKITFYPAGTRVTRTSLTKLGTFVITSIQPQGKNLLSLSTKTGINLPNDQYAIYVANPVYPSRETESTPSLFTLNEATYSNGGSKFSINSAFSFLRMATPPAQGISLFDTVNNNQKNKRYRFSNFLGYRFNDAIRLDANLFFTSNEKADYYEIKRTDTSSRFYSDHDGGARANYFGAALGMQAMILRKFENVFRAEGNQTREKGGSLTENRYGSLHHFSDIAFNNRLENYSLSNQTQWDHYMSAGVRLQASLHFRYRWNRQSMKESNITYDYTGFPVSSYAQWTTVNTRGFSASPEISLHLKQFLVIHGGVTYDTYRTSIFNSDHQNAKFYPVAGIRFNVAPLLKTDAVSELFLSSTYSSYIANLEKADMLDFEFQPSPPFSFGFTSSPVYLAATPETISKRWLSSLGIMARQNKLGFKMNYLNEKQQLITAVPVPAGQNTVIYVLVYEPIRRTGWSMEATATVFGSEKNNWKIHGVMFNEKYTSEKNSSGIPNGIPVNPRYIFGTDKTYWRGSVGTEAALGQFFMQASALLSFNEPRYNPYPDFTYMDNHALNFLLIGYRFPLQKSELKKLELSLQTRNLGLPKSTVSSAYRFRYIGICIQADL